MNEFEKAIQLLKLAHGIQSGTIAPQSDRRQDADSGWIDTFLDSWPLTIFMAQRIRLDVSSTAFLQQELEAMLARTFDVQYPALQAMGFFPVDTSIPAGAEVVAYAQYDETGHAKVVSNLSDDLPLVNSVKAKFTSPIVSLAAAYQIGFQQIRAAAFAGTPLQDLLNGAARRAIEWLQDDIAWNGLPDLGITGFLTSAAIPATTPTTGTWATATADQICVDIAQFLTEMRTACLGTGRMTHIGMGPNLYARISTLQRSTASDITVKQWILDNYRVDGLQEIREIEKLRMAGAGGTHDMVVGFEKNADNLALMVPMQFMMHPPQAQGLKYLVPCEARAAGLRTPYPLKCRTMDGC